jgi:hypothetical protein
MGLGEIITAAVPFVASLFGLRRRRPRIDPRLLDILLEEKKKYDDYLARLRAIEEGLGRNPLVALTLRGADLPTVLDMLARWERYEEEILPGLTFRDVLLATGRRSPVLDILLGREEQR